MKFKFFFYHLSMSSFDSRDGKKRFFEIQFELDHFKLRNFFEIKFFFLTKSCGCFEKKNLHKKNLIEKDAKRFFEIDERKI